jgi:large subunit ribosomal protein L30e
MSKLLEKTLKDAIKERKRILGSKQILATMQNSKLIVLSQSIPQNMEEKIQKSAKKEKVLTLNFEGSSVALGRLCGLQFRVSAISLTSLSDTSIKSLLKETKDK